MITIAFLLGVAPVSTASTDAENWQLETVATVEGQYLPLIATALAHSRMRGRRLDCYDVKVNRWTKEWRVYFAGHRDPMPPDTDGVIHVGHMPQNPHCPDVGFIFDKNGRVSRVYGSRE